MENKEHVYVSSRDEWEKWLQEHHTQKDSIWLVYDRGESRKLSYDDIVEVSLCFGWVDSRPGRVDDHKSKLYISPRKPKSTWSKTNKQRIKKLTKDGSMQQAGIRAVNLAKNNGAWSTLNKSDDLVEPSELKMLLEANKIARKNYDGFPPSSKKLILEWIYAAKRPETRHRRIQQVVEKAAENIKANHYRK